MPKASFTKKSPSAANVSATDGSLVSSPGKNRVFSTNATSPRSRRRVILAAPGEAASSMNVTGVPSSDSSASATGLSDNSGTTFPVGRPRWDNRTTRHPRCRSQSIVGREALMRIGSATWPSPRGTLKSTRTSARWPSSPSGGSDSRARLPELSPDMLYEIDAACRIPHLVVVPGGDVDQRSLDHVGDHAVDGAGMKIADVIR